MDSNFVLGKSKSQIMTCGQELTKTMVAGWCFSDEGMNMLVNSMVVYDGSSLEIILHGGALAFFGGGREV